MIEFHLTKLRRTFLVTGLALLIMMVFVLAKAPQAHAAYDGGRLIDDSVFLNAKKMNSSEIQNLLEAMGSGLATKEFRLWCEAGQTRQWYEAINAPCDEDIPVSEIIYWAAQVYGLNPQVILATLQKEQSLITDPTPSSWQLSQAMGYGCPTSGNCESSSNFPYQIDYGTWVLRYHRERANRNNNWWKPSTSWTCGTEKNYYKPNLYPGQNVKFYDGSGVHYRTHYIYSSATSAMYCYTPHAYNNPQGLYGRDPFGTTGQYYSGSYNFVLWFERWFGFTNYGSFSILLCDESVYFYEDGKARKRLVTPSAAVAWGMDRVLPIENSYLCDYPDFDLPLNNIMRSRNTGKAYLVDNQKAYILTDSVSVAWGLGVVENQDIPMFDANNILFFLETSGILPRVVTSTNPDLSTAYLIDSGSRFIIAGTANSDTKSLQLIRGYDEVAMATVSVSLLQTLEPSTDYLDFAFKISGTWYLLDHNRTRQINPPHETVWEEFLTGPSLSDSVLELFGSNSSIDSSFNRDSYSYKLLPTPKLERTTSKIIRVYWDSARAPTITRLLTNKLLGVLPVSNVSTPDGSIRLISCGGDPYLVERHIPTKRSITMDAVNGWGFSGAYFNPEDRGCNYPTYEAVADKLIRSRNSQKIYYVALGKAYYVYSQAVANNWGLGTLNNSIPQFNAKSITDNLTLAGPIPTSP